MIKGVSRKRKSKGVPVKKPFKLDEGFILLPALLTRILSQHEKSDLRERNDNVKSAYS